MTTPQPQAPGDSAAPAHDAPPAPSDVPAETDSKAGSDTPADTTEPQGGEGDEHIGSGNDASEATAQLGQGTQRHGHLRHASANIGADYVGGNKYVFLLGGRRERLRPVSPLLIERVRFAFEAPPRWDEIRECLRLHRVILLRSAAGHGKTAAAVRLLIGAGDGPIYHLERSVDFSSLIERLENGFGEAGIEPGAGFLLDKPDDIANLHGELLQSLETALLGAQATMVVTVPATELSDSELLSHVKDLPAPERIQGIVSRYLDWKLGGPASTELQAQPDVRTLVDSFLVASPTCKAAAELASALCDEYQSGKLSVDRIRARLDRLEAENFEIWAEGLTDPALRCFAIALAALNGLPHEDIAEAARALLARLDADARSREQNAARSAPTRDPFAWPRRKLLTRLRAHRPVNGPEDDTENLEYLDPEYPKLVLRHAWYEYAIQHVLLDWFRDLARNPAAQVRIYAAMALGGLLPKSWGYLQDRVLRRWSWDRDARLRAAVAYALVAAGGTDRLQPQINALTTALYADPSRPLGQATAARIHGLCPGGMETDDSVRALMRLATVDHVKVAVAVGDAFADLVADDRRLAPTVLTALWDGIADSRTRPTSLLAFLIVAASLVVETAADGPEGWPVLLHLATVIEPVQQPLVLLWREALGDASLNREAQQVLRGWAGIAERNTGLQRVLLDLLAGVVHGDMRCGRIVRRCVQDWTDRDNLAPLTTVAGSVHHMLLREGV
ncbi:hypothetical protein [Streptomyces morookaense]|uniref:Uncharacterized protein n=1 Tax=Streptomyces morookaense TaxID=1970 RepID=A0A7Y7B1G8_STRMO|nr:hypothetical protein [Streptomyces morookaense]NVK77293.1 hypothetical protein [Streptomyces morookaense]GHF18120.1 hypothetical protein GCM10010359_19740 [Streptomyces morookaense]